MHHPPDLTAMLERLARARQAAAGDGARHQHLRELAWAIQAFGERSFLEHRRDFGAAAFGQPGASPEESRFGWWYAAALFLGEHAELRKFSREDVVHSATYIDANSAAPFADVLAEDESTLSALQYRLRAFRRAGPTVLQQALLSIADEVLRVGRSLPAAPFTRSVVGSA